MWSSNNHQRKYLTAFTQLRTNARWGGIILARNTARISVKRLQQNLQRKQTFCPAHLFRQSKQ